MPTELSVAPFRIYQQLPIALEHPVAFNKTFGHSPAPVAQSQGLGDSDSRSRFGDEYGHEYASDHGGGSSKGGASVMSMGQQFAGGGGWADGGQQVHQQQFQSQQAQKQHQQHHQSGMQHTSGGAGMGGSMPMHMPMPGSMPMSGVGMAMGMGMGAMMPHPISQTPILPSTGPARLLECLPNKCLPNGMRNPYAPYAGETYMPISAKADRMTENHIAASHGASAPIPIPIPISMSVHGRAPGGAGGVGGSVVQGAPSAGWAESPFSSNSRHMATKLSLSHSPHGHAHGHGHGSSLSHVHRGRANSIAGAGSGMGLAQARDSEGWDGRSHDGHHPDPTSIAGRIGRSPGGTGVGLIPMGLRPQSAFGGAAIEDGRHARSLSASYHTPPGHHRVGGDYLMPNPSPSANSRPRRVSVGFATASSSVGGRGREDDCVQCTGGDLRRSASGRHSYSHSHSHSSGSGSPSPRSRQIHLPPTPLGSSPLRQGDAHLHGDAAPRRRGSVHGVGGGSGSESGRRGHAHAHAHGRSGRSDDGRSACSGCN